MGRRCWASGPCITFYSRWHFLGLAEKFISHFPSISVQFLLSHWSLPFKRPLSRILSRGYLPRLFGHVGPFRCSSSHKSQRLARWEATISHHFLAPLRFRVCFYFSGTNLGCEQSVCCHRLNRDVCPLEFILPFSWTNIPSSLAERGDHITEF